MIFVKEKARVLFQFPNEILIEEKDLGIHFGYV